MTGGDSKIVPHSLVVKDVLTGHTSSLVAYNDSNNNNNNNNNNNDNNNNDDNNDDGDDNNNNDNNERIYSEPFHVKHAQLRCISANTKNTKHMYTRHPKQRVPRQSCSNVQLSSKDG